jgi:hypothetical protein
LAETLQRISDSGQQAPTRRRPFLPQPHGPQPS